MLRLAPDPADTTGGSTRDPGTRSINRFSAGRGGTITLVLRVAWRSLIALLAVGVVTFVSRRFVPDSPTTVGFMYLLAVLLVASTWGFIEAAVAAVAGALCFNYFFFPPVGTLTIADPLNWVALLSFLMTALITSRLSAKAEQRARDAMERQKD